MDLADPFWRLKNLYSCKKQGSGTAIPFHMRQEQEVILRHLYDSPRVPAYIVKSRRLGLSTGIGIAMSDYCAWNGGAVGRLIERNMDFAGEKMRDIMRFAFLSMPPEITSRFNLKHKDSPQLLDPLVIGHDEALRSIIHAGVAARGGDCSFLHVSEWGPIAHKDPERSREIRTGALPAASMGRIVVETTWMGGKHGDLWELIDPIMKKDPDADGKLFFFPWHNDPECIRIDQEAISTDKEDYFRSLEAKLEKSFSREQKRWYSVTAKKQGIFMTREYPSTLAEAFEAPVEGSIYGKQIGEARAEGRIGVMPLDPNCLVHCVYDLGAPMQTVCWYFQVVGKYIRFVDVDMNMDETILQKVARMRATGYPFGSHFFPFDALQTERSGRTLATEFAAAWLRQNAEFTVEADHYRANMRFIPRTHDLFVGINRAIQLFPIFEFRDPQCSEALAVLGTYHTRPDKEGSNSIAEPVHDRSSHVADPIRYLAEAELAGMLPFKAPVSAPEWQYPSEKRKRHKPLQQRVGG